VGKGAGGEDIYAIARIAILKAARQLQRSSGGRANGDDSVSRSRFLREVPPVAVESLHG